MRTFFHALVLSSLTSPCFAGPALPVASVPTLSEWGLLSLGAAIVGAGLLLINNHRK